VGNIDDPCADKSDDAGYTFPAIRFAGTVKHAVVARMIVQIERVFQCHFLRVNGVNTIGSAGGRNVRFADYELGYAAWRRTRAWLRGL